MRARVEPQVEAIDVEPLEDKISVTTLIVYGNSSELGIKGVKAFSAKAP